MQIYLQLPAWYVLNFAGNQLYAYSEHARLSWVTDGFCAHEFGFPLNWDTPCSYSEKISMMALVRWDERWEFKKERRRSLGKSYGRYKVWYYSYVMKLTSLTNKYTCYHHSCESQCCHVSGAAARVPYCSRCYCLLHSNRNGWMGGINATEMHAMCNCFGNVKQGTSDVSLRLFYLSVHTDGRTDGATTATVTVQVICNLHNACMHVLENFHSEMSFSTPFSDSGGIENKPWLQLGSYSYSWTRWNLTTRQINLF